MKNEPGSSLATWQSKETRLRLLRRGKKFHWSINHHFDTRTEISGLFTRAGLVCFDFQKFLILLSNSIIVKILNFEGSDIGE